MNTSPSTPAEIYASQLWDLGYGRPMWYPEGTAELGDVGYINTSEFISRLATLKLVNNTNPLEVVGRFVPLFNCITSTSYLPREPKFPEGFGALQLHLPAVPSPRLLNPGPLCSRSVSNKLIEVNGSAEG